MKGAVTVWSQRGRLHLRFRHQGKQHRPALGLGDSEIDWVVAKGIAARVEGDLKTGNFDPTLIKYGIGVQQSGGVMTVAGLIDRYRKAQSGRLDPDTLLKFDAILKDLAAIGLDGREAKSVGSVGFQAYVQSLQDRGLKLRTVKHRIEAMATAWRWAMSQGMVSDQPWVSREVRGLPSRPCPPFTIEEVRRILDYLDSTGSPIAPIIRFQFGTGCRSGEAIGLLWGSVSDDCARVWFGHTVSGPNRTRKVVKNRVPREIDLPPSLRVWLQRYRPANPKPSDLVFPGKDGPFTVPQIFHPWRRALAALDIAYRKPYTTRKTLISWMIQQGKSPVEIASLTGHTVKVLLDHYADLLDKPKLLDLLDCTDSTQA